MRGQSQSGPIVLGSILFITLDGVGLHLHLDFYDASPLKRPQLFSSS